MKEFKQETQAAQVGQPPDWLAIGAIAADVLVTIIVIAGMAYDKHSATVSVLSGVTFFILFGSLVILTLSGSLTAIVTNGQNQKTTRIMHQLQYNAQMQTQQWTVADRPRLERRPSTDSLQLPESPRFVPAIPRATEELKAAAGGWVGQLFDPETGKATRITPNKGQVQIKSPEPEVVEYLESLGIVRVGENKQLYWDSALFPSRRHAFRAISTGVKPSPSEGHKGGGLAIVGEGRV